MMWRYLLGVLMLGLAANTWAGNRDVIVRDAWVGETVPGQKTASVQLNLTCVTSSGKLVAIDSPVAESAEMQRLWPSGGKVRMSKVRNVRLPRGRAVPFGDSATSTSLMLLGLKQPLKQGSHIPVNLTVMLGTGDKVVVEVNVEVRQLDLSVKHYSGQEVQDRQ